MEATTASGGTLVSVWFGLWGLLFAVYLMLDGGSLGVGICHPFLARGEEERARLYRVIAPFWDANEVWLVAAGGVTFAAFPGAYAAIFSTLYVPLMLVLFGLILRASAVELRGQWGNRLWRADWDFVFFGSSAATAFALGVVFANLFSGVPLAADGALRGGLHALLTPYAFAGGLLFALLFAWHGALFAAAKTTGELRSRATRAATLLFPPLLLAAAGFLALSAAWTPLFANHLAAPALFLLPLLSVAAFVAAFTASRAGRDFPAWGLSCAGVALFAATGVAGMHPFLLRSTLDPAAGITAASAASTPPTLKLMLGVTLLLVPLVVAYQAWAYFLFRDRVGPSADGTRAY